MLRVQVVPEQSPEKPVTVYPVLVEAVQVLAPPCATGLGSQAIAPPSGGAAMAVMG